MKTFFVLTIVALIAFTATAEEARKAKADDISDIYDQDFDECPEADASPEESDSGSGSSSSGSGSGEVVLVPGVVPSHPSLFHSVHNLLLKLIKLKTSPIAAVSLVASKLWDVFIAKFELLNAVEQKKLCILGVCESLPQCPAVTSCPRGHVLKATICGCCHTCVVDPHAGISGHGSYIPVEGAHHLVVKPVGIIGVGRPHSDSSSSSSSSSEEERKVPI